MAAPYSKQVIGKVNPKATVSGIYRECEEVRLWGQKTYGQGLIPTALRLKI